MADAPRVVFQAPTAAAAEQAQALLRELGIEPVERGDDPLVIWVAGQDYGAAATVIDGIFPPEGDPPTPPAPELGAELDTAPAPGEPPPDSDARLEDSSLALAVPVPEGGAESRPELDPAGGAARAAAKPKRRRLPPGFKVGTIAVCSAFLPWIGSVFAGFALVAAVWLLARQRTAGRWVALLLSAAAVAWQVFLFTRVGE